MSMYGMIFQDPVRDERMGVLLALLAYEQDSTEAANTYCTPIMDLRLRDMWVEKDHDGPPVLAVYTRNGGGNREHGHDAEMVTSSCIACAGEDATEHPAYLRDCDDEFDSTYRTYWFSFPASLPDEIKATLTEVAEDPRNMGDRWQQVIHAIGGEV